MDGWLDKEGGLHLKGFIPVNADFTTALVHLRMRECVCFLIIEQSVSQINKYIHTRRRRKKAKKGLPIIASR